MVIKMVIKFVVWHLGQHIKLNTACGLGITFLFAVFFVLESSK